MKTYSFVEHLYYILGTIILPVLFSYPLNMSGSTSVIGYKLIKCQRYKYVFILLNSSSDLFVLQWLFATYV